MQRFTSAIKPAFSSKTPDHLFNAHFELLHRLQLHARYREPGQPPSLDNDALDPLPVGAGLAQCQRLGQ